MQFLYKMYLRDTPHHVTPALTCQEGLSLFKRQRFDVVLLDMVSVTFHGS